MRYRELSADGALLAGHAKGREFLTYLIDCALPQDQGAYAVINGQRYDFPGSLALAPEWMDRPLTETEQRWVSAGILARTNFFGKKVKISLRNPRSGFASLDVSREEAAEYTLYEGDFFGNVFADPPVSCAAPARHTTEEAADPILSLRVGTEIDPQYSPILGKPVTRCGFVLTGCAGEPNAHIFNSVRYEEYISVYLKPQKS